MAISLERAEGSADGEIPRRQPIGPRSLRLPVAGHP